MHTYTPLAWLVLVEARRGLEMELQQLEATMLLLGIEGRSSLKEHPVSNQHSCLGVIGGPTSPLPQFPLG